MKKNIAVIAAALVFSVSVFPAAAAEHDHGAMKMDHSGHAAANVVHEEVVDGVKATFKIVDMRAMNRQMAGQLQETHHVMAELKDVKTGKTIDQAQVKAKIVGPDKAEQVKDLVGMQGHFGADFNLSKKGKYGVMVKFKPADGKVRTAKFWYTVS